MKTNSVLTFYEVANCVPIDAQKASAIEVFEQLMRLDSSKRSCKNVFQFAMSTDQLVEQIKDPTGCGEAMVRDIAQELECGAKYMFVQPVIGMPVYGCLIRDFLLAANQDQFLSNELVVADGVSQKTRQFIKSSYFNIDRLGSPFVDASAIWAYNYLLENDFLHLFQSVPKVHRWQLLLQMKQETIDPMLHCLVFNKKGQLAFKWNSEQDKMAFILKWS